MDVSALPVVLRRKDVGRPRLANERPPPSERVFSRRP